MRSRTDTGAVRAGGIGARPIRPRLGRHPRRSRHHEERRRVLRRPLDLQCARRRGFGALTVGPFQGFSVTAQVSRGFRDPVLSDRYFRGPSGRGFITGNPDLEPETSLQFDLATRYTAARTQVAVSLLPLPDRRSHRALPDAARLLLLPQPRSRAAARLRGRGALRSGKGLFDRGGDAGCARTRAR